HATLRNKKLSAPQVRGAARVHTPERSRVSGVGQRPRTGRTDGGQCALALKPTFASARATICVRPTQKSFSANAETVLRRQVNDSHSGFEIFCRRAVRVCARRGGAAAGSPQSERGEGEGATGDGLEGARAGRLQEPVYLSD